MKRVDLTNISVFDTLLEFTVEGENIDLHNNFLCTKIETDPFRQRILFHFESVDCYFRLIFFEANIFYFRFDASRPTTENGLCFENLSRIKAIMGSDDTFLDLPENKSYYEVEFYEEISFVIEAGKVILQESSKMDLDFMRSLAQQISLLESQIADLKNNLGDLDNHSGVDTTTFFASRKQNKEQLANLEEELKKKQVQLVRLQEQDRLLLT